MPKTSPLRPLTPADLEELEAIKAALRSKAEEQPARTQSMRDWLAEVVLMDDPLMRLNVSDLDKTQLAAVLVAAYVAVTEAIRDHHAAEASAHAAK